MILPKIGFGGSPPIEKLYACSNSDAEMASGMFTAQEKYSGLGIALGSCRVPTG